MYRHTINVRLLDKGGNGYDGVTINIDHPDESIPDTVISQYIENNRLRLGLIVDFNTIKLGQSEIALFEFGGFDFTGVSVTNI